MSAAGSDSTWLLTFKGSSRHRLEQLGIGIADDRLSVAQQSLRRIAKKQNFDSSEPGRPTWANGACVFVTVGDAAEIQSAIAENGIDLQAHHVLVSGRYRELVEELLQTPVGDSTRDKYQSSRKGAIKRAEQVPSKVFSHSASTDTIGPVDFVIAEVPLRLRRTFLEYDIRTSEDSRQTRTTGDRPLKSKPSSSSALPGEEQLPPRDADYGLCRKKFHLQALNQQGGQGSSSSFLSRPADDSSSYSDRDGYDSPDHQKVGVNFMQADTDPYEITHSIGSVATEDLEDTPPMPSDDRRLLDDIKENFRKQFEDLDQELLVLEYLGDPSSAQLEEISTHLGARSVVCIKIFCEFVESTSFPPAFMTASSAIEAPEERAKSITALLRELRNKAMTFLTTIQPCLRLCAIFSDGPYSVDNFATEMELRMQRLLKKIQGIGGLASLAQANKSPFDEFKALRGTTIDSMQRVFRESLSAESIRDVLEILSKKKSPMPWKLTEISEEEDDEEEELTPSERYALRQQKQKERAIRKMIRSENHARQAPPKRGVPGAFPRRGKRVA